MKPASLEGKKPRHVAVRVQLVTRQFGGGATARQVDQDQWLRPPAVRGALRFFWRALNVHRFATVAELRNAELGLFGGAASTATTPGRVAVTVSTGRIPDSSLRSWTTQPGSPGAILPGDPVATAYFPAGDMGQELSLLLVPTPSEPCATIRLSESFAVSSGSRLTDDEWKQITDSLLAFVLIGGSGSRTRRAAGALAFSSMQESAKLGGPTTLDELRKWLSSLPKAPSSLSVFALGNREAVFLTSAAARTGEEAQRRLLIMWREFRQARRHPPGWKGKSGWGRTQWPEADALRIATGNAAQWADGTSHSPRPENKGLAPRAHLGLPIVIHFKDGPTHPDNDDRNPPRGRRLKTDPDTRDLIALGNGSNASDRYASPVWLSVARVADSGDSAFVGMVLITRSILDFKVEIRQNPGMTLDPGNWKQVLDPLINLLEGPIGGQVLFSRVPD